MSMFIPEKIIQAALASGLTEIKKTLKIDDYLGDMFDVNIMGSAYIAEVKSYLTSHKIHIRQGYAIDDEKNPAWYICPSSMQGEEHFIGDLADAGVDFDEHHSVIDAYETNSHMNHYTMRVISASQNPEVSLFLEVIARYILLLSEEALNELGVIQFEVGTTDFDPLYQYLPQNYSYRTTMVSCKGMDMHSHTMDVLKNIDIYMTFSANEDPSRIIRI